MHDIDFLPLEYREQNLRRQSRPWHVVVTGCFLALVGAAAVGQHYGRRNVEAELAAITPSHELAVGQNRRLGEIQTQLKKARRAAELYTYLRHPWPRTQLLAAMLTPLPDEITFDQVQIVREKPPASILSERRPRGDKSSEEEDLGKLPPAERDLKQLREEFDKMRTVVHVAGTTADNAALHRYLGELGKCRLFSKAELDSLESTESKDRTTMHFRATLVVRPGYGQSGGPNRPPKNVVVRSEDKST